MTSTTSLKPLVLHAHDSGPNPKKAAIVLELLKLPYVVKLWDMTDSPHGLKGPIYTKINENGRAPAIEDPNTGVVSWESGAVINSLLRGYDKENLLGPRGDTEQDRVDFEKWILFLLTTLGPMTGQLIWFRRFSPTTNEEAIDRYLNQTYRTYMVLEGQLEKSGGKSVLPGGFSAVDVHFYPWVDQHKNADLSLDAYPNLKKWYEQVGELKEVKAAWEKVSKGEYQ